MKKLITCASVILAVCAVNAASFVWGFGAGDYEALTGTVTKHTAYTLVARRTFP